MSALTEALGRLNAQQTTAMAIADGAEPEEALAALPPEDHPSVRQRLISIHAVRAMGDAHYRKEDILDVIAEHDPAAARDIHKVSKLIAKPRGTRSKRVIRR